MTEEETTAHVETVDEVKRRLSGKDQALTRAVQERDALRAQLAEMEGTENPVITELRGQLAEQIAQSERFAGVAKRYEAAERTRMLRESYGETAARLEERLHRELQPDDEVLLAELQQVLNEQPVVNLSDRPRKPLGVYDAGPDSLAKIMDEKAALNPPTIRQRLSGLLRRELHDEYEIGSLEDEPPGPMADTPEGMSQILADALAQGGPKLRGYTTSGGSVEKK